MAPVLTKNPISDEDSNSNDQEPRRKKKRASRWAANESEKAFIPGIPTMMPSNMTQDQEKAYLTQLRIEEISRMLRSGELGIPTNPENRSPSPEPIYDSAGKRLNTREVRMRAKLDSERHKLITEMLKLNPQYMPPADYKAPSTKVIDKVFIPQDDHPEINFVGLLIGPRGNTLKMLEKDTGAKIIIRGKGSIKENKIGRKDGQPLPGEDEPLHAYITGPSVEVVAKACEKVREIVQQGIDLPETANDLRRNQLRELALLNGTLRENDSLNKLKIIAQAQTIVTNTIICGMCGSAGHITSDCKMKTAEKEGEVVEKKETWAEREKMDSEYISLMAELGQGKSVDPSKIPAGKSIVPRGGASAAYIMAIESGGQSPNTGSDYSNSPKPSENSTGIPGVVECEVDGKKVIDFTQIARQSSGPKPITLPPNAQPPPFLQAANRPKPVEEIDTTANVAASAAYYSQQMNYYAQMGMPYPGMPMWPGYGGWMPPVPSGAVPPPPPPPPPPPSN